MVRIKVFKASQLLYWAVIIIVAVALLGLIASALLNENGAQARPPVQTETPESVPLPDAGGSSSRGSTVDRRAALALGAPSSPLEEASSAAAAMQPIKENAANRGFFVSLSRWLLSVDLSDPLSLMSFHLPLAQTEGIATQAQLTATAAAQDEELPGESEAGEHIYVEIARIDEPYRPAPPGKILIYHTHTYEAYEQDDEDPYVEASAQWRTKEQDKSIVAVGEALADALEKLGYSVVHDKTEFEPPKLGTSYERSLAMLKTRAEAGEEYALVIDMHRDAWDNIQGKKMTVAYEGEAAARLMMLIGTGEGSEGNTFSIKPNWKENYKLADALTNTLNEIAPGICRDILVKTGRYNQHVWDHSVLVEVGNNRNTLDEALQAVKPLAAAIDSLLSP